MGDGSRSLARAREETWELDSQSNDGLDRCGWDEMESFWEMVGAGEKRETSDEGTGGWLAGRRVAG